MQNSYYSENNYSLFRSDCNDIMPTLNTSFDIVFVDPPYFLSNDGLTIKSGKVVSVNKGGWDKLDNLTLDEFNHNWISKVRNILKPTGTIWVSGTMHNIFSVYKTLMELDFKILNTLIWEKTNPPPNFSCRVFTHSNELIIWARKEKKIPHYFNYPLMRELNNNKQMKDIWRFPAISRWEKTCGNHPTQKPLSILNRIILASTQEQNKILDPFSGSGTTGIAANLLNRDFPGIEIETDYLDLSIRRKAELDLKGSEYFKNKINNYLKTN